jgi:hypothetical protein
MALNKAQGFGYPFLKRWKTYSNHPQNKTPAKSSPKKDKSQN